MKRIILSLAATCLSSLTFAQTPNLDSWQVNTDGTFASFWEETSPGTYELTELSDLADVQSVCYTNDSIWVSTDGLTTRMGFYQNPGTPGAQGVIYRMPKSATEQTGSKTETPIVFSVGVLINGISIFGNGDATSYDQTAGDNEPMGAGIWNGDAWYSEGFTLDSAYGAHPNGDGGTYHTHATPFFLYEDSVGHSPIVGFAFDGYPIYGPYAHSDSLNLGSSIVRMETSYRLRSITQRHTLPDGSVLSPSDYGPDVNGSFPLGVYIEDYEYVSALGHLDEHNGRWCVTPEYPSGTYAYFVTIDASEEPAFPYYIGEYYYGVVDEENFATGSVNSVDGSATCIGDLSSTGGDLEDITPDSAVVGSTSVTVTFSFAADVDPATPPVSVAPDVVTIGGINGTSISRDNSSGDVTATFDLSSLVVGEYDLEVTFSPPMGSDIDYLTEDGFKIIPSGPTSVDDILAANVKIYPNPAKDKLTIESPSDVISVSIVNLQGAVYSFDSNSIDVSSLRTGVYVIQIQTVDGIVTSQLVIE